MRIFLFVLLIVHVVMEGGLGLTLLLAPQRVMPNADLNTLTPLITYGGAAVTMALVVVWFWPWRQSFVAVSMLLGILASFHSMLVVAASIIILQGGDGKILMMHAVLAVCFWWLWFKRKNLMTEPSDSFLQHGA